jgi:hypothetical protein
VTTAPAEPEERCERSDLPVSMCGMSCHRGGRTPEESAELDRVIYGPGPWFFAQWGGWCERGSHRFQAGTTVRYDGGPEKAMECQGCTR